MKYAVVLLRWFPGVQRSKYMIIGCLLMAFSFIHIYVAETHEGELDAPSHRRWQPWTSHCCGLITVMSEFYQIWLISPCMFGYHGYTHTSGVWRPHFISRHNGRDSQAKSTPTHGVSLTSVQGFAPVLCALFRLHRSESTNTTVAPSWNRHDISSNFNKLSYKSLWHMPTA